MLHDGYFLDAEYGLWSWYEYGAVAWIWWLDEACGSGDGTLVPQLWVAMSQEGGGPEPDVLDAWSELCGDWTEGMVSFAVERARVGTDAGPEWSSFAGAGAMALREAALAKLPATFAPEWSPYPLGTTYVDVAVQAGDEIAVSLSGDTDVEWGLVAVEAATESTAVGTELTHTATEDGTLTLGVVNLGPIDLDANDPLDTSSFELLVDRVETETPLGDPEQNDLDDEGGCACGISRPGHTGAAWLLLVYAAIRRRLARPAPNLRSAQDSPRSTP